ncbi:hypothetical protein KM043_018624 [Ampulex compressa]|nr:hypothetical protein KM043_018624 [Ampulex compressa]
MINSQPSYYKLQTSYSNARQMFRAEPWTMLLLKAVMIPQRGNESAIIPGDSLLTNHDMPLVTKASDTFSDAPRLKKISVCLSSKHLQDPPVDTIRNWYLQAGAKSGMKKATGVEFIEDPSR